MKRFDLRLTRETHMRSPCGVFIFTAFVLSLTAFGSSAATPPAKNDGATAVEPTTPYARGLLWQIDGNGRAPSYLFGTLHSNDRRVVVVPHAVDEALAGARTFSMEVLAEGGTSSMVSLDPMFYSDGRTLKRVLGDALYAQAYTALEERGLPSDWIKKMKPWAVITTLSSPPVPANADPFLDLVLLREARQAGKPVYGLVSRTEHLDSVIAAYDGLPLPDQIDLVKETLSRQPQRAEGIEGLVRAYLARDLERLAALARKYGTADPRLQRMLNRRLLSDRNRRMVERMKPRLEEGKAFIAVGAGHLSGTDGLLDLLEREGYRVHVLY
ncbi:MAG: TraB/GumN family protein [Sulfurifustaceae bacterium]